MSPRVPVLKRSGRRLRWMAAALLTGALVVAATGLIAPRTRALRQWVETRVAGALTEATGRPARVRLRSVRLFRLHALFDEVVVRGAAPDARDLLNIRRLEAQASWVGLLGRRPRLSRLVAETVDLDLEQLPGRRGPPANGASSAERLLGAVVVDSLELRRGSVRLADAEIPLRLLAEEVGLLASYRPTARGYEGSLRVGAARIAVGDLPAISLSAGTRFVLDGRTLKLEELDLTGSGMRASGRVEFRDLEEPALDARFSGSVDLAEFPLLSGTNAAPDGSLSLEGGVAFHGGALTGRMRLASARIRWGGLDARDLRGGLVLGPEEAHLSGLRFSLAGLRVDGDLRTGPIPDLAPFRASLRIEGDGSSSTLAIPGIGDVRLSGPVQGECEMEGERLALDALRGSAWIRAHRLGLRGFSDLAEDLHAQADLGQGALTLRRLALRASGADVDARGTVGLTGPSSIDLAVHVPRLEETAGTVRSLGWTGGSTLPLEDLRGALRLDARLDAGPVLEPAVLETLQGDLTVHLEGAGLTSAPELAVSGRILAGLARGRASELRVDLRSPELSLEGEGVAGPRGIVRLRAGALLPRLGPGVESTLALLRALGWNLDDGSRLAGLGGRLRAQADLSGPWNALEGTARLEARDLAWRGRELGDLEADLGFGGSRWSVSGAVASDAARVRFEGLAESAPSWSGRLRLEAEDQILEPLVQLAGLELPLSGTIRGDLDLAFPGGEISGAVVVVDGSFYDVPVRRFEADFSLVEERLQVLRGILEAAGGRGTFRGTLGGPEEKTDPLTLRVEGLRLEQLVPGGDAAPRWEGAASLEARVTGPVRRPILLAEVQLDELALYGRPQPSLRGSVRLGEEAVHAELASPEDPSGTSLRMDLRRSGSWSGELSYPLDVELAGAGGDEGTAESVRATGDLSARFESRGTDVSSLRGEVTMAGGRIQVGGYELVPAETVRLRFEAGTAVLEPVRLDGEGTEVDLSGTIALGGAHPLSFAAQGRVDLRALAPLSDRVRLSGVVQVDLSAEGVPEDLRWEGTLSLEGGHLRLAGFPDVLRDGRAFVRLSRDRWRLENFRATLGGGEVTGTGSMEMAGLQLRQLQAELEARGVRLGYPEGFRSEADARLRLRRSQGEPPLLEGRVDILRGLYGKPFRLERQLLARTREFEPGAEVEAGLLDEVRLDLKVVADDGLWIRNDVAHVETKADLDVRGTVRHPEISGRIEALDDGKLTFRSNHFHLTTGSIDFSGEPGVNPSLDLQGVASIADHDVLLAVTGRLEEPQVEISSTPHLPQADIVALLLSGRTREELSASGGLSEAEAARYLTGLLSEDVQRGLKHSLGLDEVRVDPVLIEDQDNPAARVTLTKVLSSRLTATYSSEVGSAREDVYRFRYRLRDHLDFVGTREDDASLSGELRYAARAYVGGTLRTADRDDVPAGRRIERVTFSGHRAIGEKRLRRLLGLRPRDEYRRSRLLEGVEEIQGWYVRNGYPEVGVDHSASELPGELDVAILINEGRNVTLAFPGAPEGRKLRRQVLEAWERTLFREEVLEETAGLVDEELRSRGYVWATVDADATSSATDRIDVVFHVEPGPRVRVAAIGFKGNRYFDERRLRNQMLTEEASLLRRGYLRPAVLADDREAIRSLYVNSGFLDAVVSDPRIEYPVTRKRAEILVPIDEGPRYTIASVTFEGNSAISESTLHELAGLAPGAWYLDPQLREAEVKIKTRYDALGFSDVHVASDLHVDREQYVVDIVFRIQEGPRRFIRDVEIRVAGITRPEIVRRELEVKAGDPLSARRLSGSRTNLYRTGLFRKVEMQDLPGEGPDGRRVVFDLAENPNLRVGFGFGFDSEDGLRLSANLGRENLFGRRIYGGVTGRWSEADSRYQLIARQPRFLGSRLDFLTSSFREKEEQDGLEVTRLGTSVQLSRRFRDGRYVALGRYELQDVDIFQGGVELDPAADPAALEGIGFDLRREGDVRLGSLSLGVIRDTRDAVFWPSAGSRTRAEIGTSDDALLSEAEFASGFLQWNRYQRIGRRWVWAAGARLGIQEPYGSTELVPVSERFFLGGENSVRGFRRDSLEAVGFPEEELAARGVFVEESQGGQGLFVLNQELMARLVDPWNVVFFVDAGNLYWQPSDFDATDLRYSAGLGVRVRTPIGPLRLEYGWNLNRREDEDRGRLHFSIGLPF